MSEDGWFDLSEEERRKLVAKWAEQGPSYMRDELYKTIQRGKAWDDMAKRVFIQEEKKA